MKAGVHGFAPESAPALTRPVSTALRREIDGKIPKVLSRSCSDFYRAATLHAVTHTDAVQNVIAAMPMRNRSAIRPDKTDAVDASRTDHGICISTVDNHGRPEGGDCESSDTNRRIVASLAFRGQCFVFGAPMRWSNPSNAQSPAGSVNVLQA